MKILVAGNKNYGLAEAIGKRFKQAYFCSRSSGYDFDNPQDIKKFISLSIEFDIIILCSALNKFKQSILLIELFNFLKNNMLNNKKIIVIGSNYDRVKRGLSAFYPLEKQCLRHISECLSMIGVYDNAPKVTLISFGLMENKKEKYPDRKTLKMEECVDYIEWVINQPNHIHINELSIDHLQKL
ncbi:MAG: hypothetical protein NZZ41_01015 [Candidatus Dojkabacteria bacterium]|nr:hypothetical protein [Candidatus Dojkabacteria bacterium]